MNPANKRVALIEAALDTQEGADFLMVKPALNYLDVIHLLKEHSNLPMQELQAKIKQLASDYQEDVIRIRRHIILGTTP